MQTECDKPTGQHTKNKLDMNVGMKQNDTEEIHVNTDIAVNGRVGWRWKDMVHLCGLQVIYLLLAVLESSIRMCHCGLYTKNKYKSLIVILKHNLLSVGQGERVIFHTE